MGRIELRHLIGIEFLSDIAAGFLGALIAVSLSGVLGFWQRALLMATIGLIATIDIDGSYWNWYGFPTTYLLAQFADHVVGWFLAGLVLARVCRRSIEIQTGVAAYANS